MVRQDLLALTIDDLVTLSNRGIVKRSQQELQSGQLTYELNEDDNGNVSVHWSDQVQCKLPSDRTLGNSQCTCPATTLCRHLIRSVLVYQQLPARQQGNKETEQNTPLAPSAPWNPGDITDETLAQHFKKTTFSKLKNQFDAGHVVSLTRSSKPLAHIHTLSCTIRFLVANDVRYTIGDKLRKRGNSQVWYLQWSKMVGNSI